jgi:predicted amidohydrolase
MPRTLSIAAVRMDANPAPLESRLERANALISRAVKQAAQLVVLPEVFNTGYEYTVQNYQLAEPLDGRTVSWMREVSREQGIYLAGSLLVREADGIYNAMLLVAPDGRLWRYDKSYPWAWERAYFRPREKPVQVAETDFGKIGMLICWDVAHANLWAKYAGKIDLFVSSSCPPLVHKLNIHFPDGKIVHSKELGKLFQLAYRDADKTFGEFYLQQARWLGVPSVNTTGAGLFQSHFPQPKMTTTAFFAARPDLWKYISQAEKIIISTGYFDSTFIADANGNALAQTTLDGDDLALATVQLADQTPLPVLPQPKFGLSGLTYLVDAAVNAAFKNYYDLRWRGQQTD